MNSYTYVISDIHGEYDAFVKMLEKIKFNDNDILYVIGDVIDRGPEPIKTLLHIMKAKNIVLLAGNHEYMATLCLNYLFKEISEEVVEKLSDGMIMGLLREWQINGGGGTLQELLECDKETRNAIFNYLTKLKLYKELEVGGKSFILVHAGLGNFDKNKKLKDYNIMELVWKRMDYDKVYFEDKYLITGHTPTQGIEGNENPGYIYKNGKNFDIDCGCVFEGGRLGCLRLDDMKEFYV